MVLWEIHRIDLVIFRGTTMFFNTALCMSLSAIGLFLLTTRFTYLTSIIGLIVSMFAFLVLLQDLFQIDLKIDQLFVNFYYPLENTIPGRMATQTTFNFILVGICLVLLSFSTTSARLVLANLILASLLLVTTGSAIFGYLLQYPQIYDWARHNPIAINTVVPFLLLSIGLILAIVRKCLQHKINIAGCVHFVIFFAAFGVALLLWQSLTHEEHANFKQISHNLGLNLLENFKTNLDSEVNNQDPVIFRTNGFPEHLLLDVWQKYSEHLLQSKKNVVYIGLFTEDLREIKSTSSVSHSITPEFFKDELSRQNITLSNPVILNEKTFILAMYPVMTPSFKGYIVKSIDVAKLITQSKDFSFVLMENNQVILHSNSSQTQDQEYIEEFKIKYYAKEWTLRVWPTDSFIKSNHSNLPNIIFLIVLLFGFLLATSFHIARVSTERSKKLKKIQANLLSAHQIANLGGWVWNLEDDNIHFTQDALRILGLNSNQEVLPADQFFYLVHPNETKKMKQAISAMKKGRSGYSEIYTFVRLDKEIRQIRFAAEVSAFDNDYPSEISGIIQDVTKIKALEEEVYQFQKMELIGQLTGGIAHDFNNILMIIQGNLELLSLFLDKSSKEYKKVETALNACLRGSALTKRLLTFARRDSLHPEVIHLKSYMENFQSLLTTAMGESINVFIELDKDVTPIKIDPNQLESALLNLAINSRDAMGQGGMLKIKIQNVFHNQADTLIKEKLPYGPYVKISVIDSGTGIPPEVLRHAFEPFYTTKAATKGTGLGLSMVKGFVEQSKGYIHLSSKPGTGTTVDLYFVAFEEKKALHKQEDDFSAKVCKGNETILVVEDEDAVRETTVEYLQSLGYAVLEAKNGDSAFEILKKNNNIDLLFTDVVMPGQLSGRDLADEALKLHPNLKILFTSGYPERAKGNGYSLSPLIIKPYKLIDLAINLREFLNKL
ncbi:MAG: response regulator [Proteobacteria bacterium]|nr:response regulator [Pseudomonadota bacterium]